MLKIKKDKYKFKSWAKYTEKNPVILLDLLLFSCWKNIFKKKKSLVENIQKKLSQEIKEKKIIFPYPKLLFNTFNIVKFKKVNVVILGQDPYKNIVDDVPEATGMSFSVPEGVKIPSSLHNIYLNMKKFGHIDYIPNNGNLVLWNIQGCLLLNSSLTLRKGEENSHQKYWTELTDHIISKLSAKRKNIVFVLWGAFALKKKELINEKKHKIIVTSHPSGLSYNRKLGDNPAFVNYDTFGEVNKYLMDKKKTFINWQIPKLD